MAKITHPKYRKGEGEFSFSTTVKIILGIILLILMIVIAYKLVTGKHIWEGLIEPYLEPEIKENAYFAATNISLINIDEMKSKYNCQADSSGKVYECDQNVQIEIAVNIKNTGTLAIPVYARPRIGNDCNNEAECSGEAFLDGQKKCFIYDPSKEQECSIGYKYVFDDEDTEYRIYPGAMMTKEDYVELTKEYIATDITTHVNNDYIIIETR